MGLYDIGNLNQIFFVLFLIFLAILGPNLVPKSPNVVIKINLNRSS